MTYLLMAIVCSFIGVIPLILRKRMTAAIILGVAGVVVYWFLFWLFFASIVGPFFGPTLWAICLLWIVSAVIDTIAESELTIWVIALPVCLIVFRIVVVPFGGEMLRSDDFAAVVGPMEERIWTQDVQPKDPRHIRLANSENALYRAKNAISKGGTVGSQFEVLESSMTLQKIKGALWFVVPLDFRDSYGVWSSTKATPGYIMISAEEEGIEPIFKTLPEEKKIKYSPRAYFDYNLERHLRMHGYLNIGLTDYTFEIDESGNPWWIISTFQPTILNTGKKVNGVVIVNPSTGESTAYALDKIPAWIDRAMPKSMVMQYMEWWGEFKKGWINSWWGKLGVLEPEEPILVFGSDDTLDWVIGMTSKNKTDTSLVGLAYINSRTGKAVYYKTNGGSTDTAILEAVANNQYVKIKNLHAADPQIYNLYGTMASIMPLLNASHARQGVAIVDVTDIQKVAVGADMYEALNNYQEMMGNKAGVALEKTRDLQKVVGIIDRIHPEIQSNGTVYHLHLKGIPHLFVGGKSLSRKITVTESGDQVSLEYYASGEEEVPMYKFDNLSLPLAMTKSQKEVSDRVTKMRDDQKTVIDSETTKERIKDLTPEQIKALEKMIPPKKQ